MKETVDEVRETVGYDAVEEVLTLTAMHVGKEAYIFEEFERELTVSRKQSKLGPCCPSLGVHCTKLAEIEIPSAGVVGMYFKDEILL